MILGGFRAQYSKILPPPIIKHFNNKARIDTKDRLGDSIKRVGSLSKEIIDLLDENNMEIEFIRHIGAVSPRKSATGIWVGVEVIIPTGLIIESIHGKKKIREVISKWYEISSGNKLEHYCFPVRLVESSSIELYEIEGLLKFENKKSMIGMVVEVLFVAVKKIKN